MTAQSIISRYNHMNGNAVSGATLREFHDSIQKYLDRSGTGPFTHAINGIRKRLAAVLNRVKTNDVVEVRVKVIDSDEQVAGYQVPVKVVKKKKAASIPEQHRKKIEAKNKRMPKPIRNVMNGNDQDLLHGLELNPIEAHESGLGFTQTGQQKIYDMVTEMILEAMKKDGLFWRKPWNLNVFQNKIHAQNFSTKKEYSGVNFWTTNFIVPSYGYKSIYFLTFNQAQAQGGKIKKGAKAWPVFYYNLYYIINKPQRKTITEEQYNELTNDQKREQGAQKLPIIQYYNVFNGDDIDGIEFPKIEAPEVPIKERIESCEKIVENMPMRPPLKHGGDRAFYNHADFIQMPLIESFDKEQEYYSTLFHEMVHSTGHTKRLNRWEQRKNFTKGSSDYAFEELIAELGASYIDADAGILYFTLNNSAVYIKGWQSRLRDAIKGDNKFFLKAAAKAQQAADFILDRKKTEVVEVPKSKRESKKSRPPVERQERSQATAEHSKKPATGNRQPATQLSGVVDAQTLADISYSTFDLAPEWKKEFHKINSDSVLMIWGKPGSGKTVKLLKLAQHLSADLNKKVLYVAEEEYGRSTLADKLTEHKIGNGNLSFAPDLDEGIVRNFDAVFLDSVNSMHLSPADVKNLIRKYPGKCWVLIVQTTKEGDFRGGRDWEHLVDIAGEVVNRKMILRKNRLDPNNKAKADKLLVEEIVTEKKQAQEIKDLVKQKIEGEQKQQAA